MYWFLNKNCLPITKTWTLTPTKIALPHWSHVLWLPKNCSSIFNSNKIYPSIPNLMNSDFKTKITKFPTQFDELRLPNKNYPSISNSMYPNSNYNPSNFLTQSGELDFQTKIAVQYPLQCIRLPNKNYLSKFHTQFSELQLPNKNYPSIPNLVYSDSQNDCLSRPS